MPPLSLPLKDAKFSLNAWGVAGIFGGEESISAMALIPLYQGRRWLGWYNSPGSLDVARRFGRLAQSHFWQHLFPNTAKSPATLFGFDGKVGPKYTAALSGTKMRTAHLGYLTIEHCKEFDKVTVIQSGRAKTTPAHVVLVDLSTVDYEHNLPRLSGLNAFLALIPILASVATCIMCALVYDWYNLSVILVGIIANGFASVMIGSGKLTLTSVKEPAPGSPRGDGILVPLIWEDIVVVVKGAENAVNAITKGKFAFELGGRPSQHAIGICSILLILQFLAQLLLIPQGTLFGQVMFVSSLCISWIYTFYVSSFRRESLLANLLFQKLGDPRMCKFRLLTRTAVTALVAFLVFHQVPHPTHVNIYKILSTLIPNDTVVWDRWREKVARQVCNASLSCLEPDDDKDLSKDDKALLTTLLGDAREAHEGYLQWAAAPPLPPHTSGPQGRGIVASILGQPIQLPGGSLSRKTLKET